MAAGASAARTQAVLAAVLIGGATLAVFWGAIACAFVNLDDDLYVYDNPFVREGLTLRGVAYAVKSVEGGSWMPLTWVSYMLDAQLWGTGPAGYHATNVILHALSASLLFLALRRMTGVFWPCAFAAALFAVHPLRVESVVWIAERKDVLSGVFFMLTLIAYAQYAAKPGKLRMAGTLVCLLLGLMAKPMLVTVPALLLLLDGWPLRRAGNHWPELKVRLPALLVEKTPLWVLSAAFSILALGTQSWTGAVAESELGHGQILRVAENYLFYLGKIFWPADLNVLYPITPVVPFRAIAALAALVAISLVSLRWSRLRPWFTVGWFWFAVSLLPVIGVVPIGSTWVADRYTYLPSIGIGLLVAWGANALLPLTLQGRVSAAVGAALIVAGCGWVTLKNIPRWKDSSTLFSDSISKGAHPGAYQNLGIALAERGDYENAIAHYTRALELEPRAAEACYNRGLAFQARGDAERALADYSQAIELRPAYAEAHNNRGNLHAARGEFEAAIRDFTQAIALRPDYTEALANRGRARQEVGKYSEAAEDYSRAIATRPDFALAYHDRAVIFYHLKDYERAWSDLRTCRQLGLTPNPELVRRLEADSGSRWNEATEH
jgi:tetratricopeptide (TPR) repeat protein